MNVTYQSSMDDKNYETLMDKAIERGLTKLGIVIKGDAVTGCPVNYGELKGSITYATNKSGSTPKTAGAGISKPISKWRLHVGSGLEYAEYVEYGTRPHFPPLSAIADWAKAKRIPDDAVFPIARSISKKGTKAQPYLRPALDANRSRAPRILQGEVTKALQSGK